MNSFLAIPIIVPFALYYPIAKVSSFFGNTQTIDGKISGFDEAKAAESALLEIGYSQDEVKLIFDDRKLDDREIKEINLLLENSALDRAGEGNIPFLKKEIDYHFETRLQPHGPGKVSRSDLEHIISLMSSGDIYVVQLYRASKAREYYSEAQKKISDLRLQRTPLYYRNLINLANASAAEMDWIVARQYYLKVIMLLNEEGQEHNPLQRIALTNLAQLYYAQKNYKEALKIFTMALVAFEKAEMQNTILYMNTINNAAHSSFMMGDRIHALKLNEESIQLCKSLGMTHHAFFSTVLRKKSEYVLSAGNAEYAKQLQLAADQTDRRNFGYVSDPFEKRIRTYELKDAFGYVIPGEIETNSFGLTFQEQERLRSYTGAFLYRNHAQHIRSRTYTDRLKDHNIFLADLLNKDVQTHSLENLRKKLFPDGYTKEGKGVVFIDIGPALANIETTAATSISIAKEFKKMTVVALELPEQVDHYYRDVPTHVKNRIVELDNMKILSGDGIPPLRPQMEINSAWIMKDRKSYTISSNDVLILRAANSIDIYFEWETLVHSFLRLAIDFRKNSVLYFFNRSILFKPAGSTRFHIIGYFSKAGYEHNYVTFDRQGDPAYTLTVQSHEK